MSVCACVCVCPRLFRNEMCVRVSSAEEKVSALASLKVFFLSTHQELSSLLSPSISTQEQKYLQLRLMRASIPEKCLKSFTTAAADRCRNNGFGSKQIHDRSCLLSYAVLTTHYPANLFASLLPGTGPLRCLVSKIRSFGLDHHPSVVTQQFSKCIYRHIPFSLHILVHDIIVLV